VPTHRWKELHERKLTKEQISGVRRQAVEEARAMNLRGLRESLGKTQRDIARKASMSQSQLSRVEGRHDHLLSTLRKYVRALGGEMDVIVRVGDKFVSLRDV
jgi:predicted transcriptional regulator